MNILEKMHSCLMSEFDAGKLKAPELDEISMNLIQQFSWIIPTDEVLDKFKGKDIVEMGAGRGYWAKLYSKCTGGAVSCYDLYPQYNCFYPVEQSGPHILTEFDEDWTLFICSPAYRSDMVLESLKYFNGESFMYAGDTNFSLNLPSIQNELEENWILTDKVDLPNWPNSNNKFLHYIRRNSHEEPT